ncbi:hypothetical protein IGI04_014777 [Brassica rapa subsp. trilocularis]|uniref:Uncharacterized protein n=1 Tax=Brassica rapa subsp. trilocularis TaxID=1813537 RepID=A0ABQ7MN72_BRACM|nr:hypothetical protein IGI04_014777 [Brassica rapa subsp. trilocularis]
MVLSRGSSLMLLKVLEFPLEILEVLGSIWDQKGSGKCCLGEQSTRAGVSPRCKTSRQPSILLERVSHVAPVPRSGALLA